MRRTRKYNFIRAAKVVSSEVCMPKAAKNKLVPEVWKVIQECSSIIANHEEDTFSQDTFSECLERGMESPIEHILYTAFKTITRINFIRDAEPTTMRHGEFVTGLNIQPQVKIGDYRVDFLISDHIYRGQGKVESKEVIVECDSQQFHERTEQE